MRLLRLIFAPRHIALLLSMAFFVWVLFSMALHHERSHLLALPLVIFGGLTTVGVGDVLQKRHSVLRNYPILAHLRFIIEEIRPEIRQYLFESETDGAPFSRDRRAVVYQRAKMQLDKRPFGTQLAVYADGFEWMLHSLNPKPVATAPFRIDIGGPHCKQPYSASVLNISAMSFGSLSANAIRALNGGAKLGNFAHDTGEGGFSPYHAEKGGDVIWEIGSGYFGCRTPEGVFSPEHFAATAQNPQIKMVEIKLSQGAKPGHGGVLPAAKVTPEISAIRGVPVGRDCVSPPGHSAFSTPLELMAFIQKLRELSSGKPVGVKFCLGQPIEFLGVCKAMLESGTAPDFIVVDGKEGGTGAAPLEFMDHLGMPMRDGLSFVHNALVGIGLRRQVKIGCAGKILTAFDMARAMAIGADWCNSARGFMFSIGCIQSLSCHTDACPTGVATQDPWRGRALHVPDKVERVANFHRATLHVLAELTAAAGLEHPEEFTLDHFRRRILESRVVSFADLYPALEEGELLSGARDPRLAAMWEQASAERFSPRPA
ncbi:FMN-binding glutamate synthase family protein [Rhodoblastus acidophilus]|uniref:FMN-binding glutamate synthase family protein n=1 Tax=Candidatus Rhodoblastus alkanivorans TaxID=2954117 RepID=A0ABS9ZCL1_9HYPH|nr:FMN-binding glutamate synthase family protein [Candidatus Rhodoblastus alkanivorans]MCI4679773.1 FMN-binding glutamate synthase family protein [Candidatus Rhodoblastus alkanivorans]MCI4684307.1 FMN-binding glutamate synthase family protein [Candidatus Rhodoblastus alkanivorans]MDI4641628.1 FMN-binding glutamate synthase family protein [Rhodoblastus acidophilus]